MDRAAALGSRRVGMRHDQVSGQTGSDGSYRLVVFTCDEDRQRCRSIADVASQANARVVSLGDLPALPSFDPTSSIGVGFVHLGVAANVSGLGQIRALTKAGVRVLAYAHRLGDWPIGLRCRALLAGAVALVDSARPDFIDDIWARATAIANAEARLARDQEEVRLTFRKLGIVGVSAAMRELFRWTVRISRLSDLHALITGETGTGKQLFAEAIHQLDPKRRHGPLVSVNCGAISPGLAEAELFGHRRGAFTGAERERKGLIRASHGGVLFLDEIGEMDLALQAKVLRVLQEGRVLSLGDDDEVAVDVRVIAATNRNLEEMVANKTFRADLFHRLTILSMRIPPIRERRDDLGALVEHFVSKHGHLVGPTPPRVGEDFMAALAQAELAGNAREVENVVRHAIVHGEGEPALTLSDLPPEMWTHVSQLDAVGPPIASGDGADPRATLPGVDPALGSAFLWQTLSTNGWSLSRSLASCERSLVEGALRSTNGNQSRAARLLGLTPRSIYNKVRKYQLPQKSA